VAQSFGPLGYMLQPNVLKRSSTIALVVGVALSAINQADVILYGPLTRVLALKLGLNFVVPFVVSSVSAAANRPGSDPPPA
jgi:hypothetical protein